MSTINEKRQAILEAVASDLREVIGEDWGSGLEVGLETSFSSDLEIESVEMVALSERLQARYGDSLDLAGWLFEMDLDRIAALTVGDLVEQVERCTS